VKRAPYELLVDAEDGGRVGASRVELVAFEGGGWRLRLLGYDGLPFGSGVAEWGIYITTSALRRLADEAERADAMPGVRS